VRYWTVEEAQAYLPRLRLLLGVIRRAAHLAVSAKGNGHATLPGAPAPAGPRATDPEAAAPGPGVASSSDEGGPQPPATAEGSPRSGPEGDADGEGATGEGESPVSFDVKEALAELEDKGIVLRDPKRGLIDFPALHAGREVLLCWQLGEEGLEWWHLPEEGFAGRRPLPMPPEL
jgi:hypothetical protein